VGIEYTSGQSGRPLHFCSNFFGYWSGLLPLNLKWTAGNYFDDRMIKKKNKLNCFMGQLSNAQILIEES
jgi:hypothetical protein